MYANDDIRREARANGVPFWRIANALSISEPTMTRRLRHELPQQEKEKIKEAILQLAHEREAG